MHKLANAAVFLSLMLAITLQPRCGAADDAVRSAVLRVGVKPAAPFVMVDKATGKITGFSIDLVEAVAAQMRPARKVKLVLHEDIEEHLRAVRSGQVDLGIAATSFSSHHEQELDFSVPFYQGGLGIATIARGNGLSFWDFAASKDLCYTAFWLVIFLVGCAHVIWATERGQNNTFDDGWLKGVGQATWWTIVTMTTVGYGDFVPRKPLSRILGILIIVTGIVLFGVAVGVFSSALTLDKLSTDIRVLDDLRNKRVAVVRNTIGARTLRNRGVELVEMESLGEVLMAIERGDVVAGVHDVALLRYHLPRDAPQLTLVGPTFAERGYGITFPLNSGIRKDVNIALLQLMENDPPRYQWMLEQWFDSN